MGPPTPLLLRHTPLAPPLSWARRDSGVVTLHRAVPTVGSPGPQDDWAADVIVERAAGRVVVLKRVMSPAIADVVVDAPWPVPGTPHYSVYIVSPGSFNAMPYVGGSLVVGSVRVDVVSAGHTGARRNGAAVRASPRWCSQSRGLRGRRGRPARGSVPPRTVDPGRIIRCRFPAGRPRVHRAWATANGHHRYGDLYHGGHVSGSYRSHREHGQRNAAAGNPDPASAVRGHPTRSRLLRPNPGQGRADGSDPRRSISRFGGRMASSETRAGRQAPSSRTTRPRASTATRMPSVASFSTTSCRCRSPASAIGTSRSGCNASMGRAAKARSRRCR